MNTFYHSLKNLWGQIRFRYNYSVISNASGSVSFALIGNASGRNPYCRTYLGQRDFPQTRAVWYRGGTAIAPKLRRNHGLVVLSEMAATEQLLNEVLHVPNFLALGINLPGPDADAYMKSLTASMRSNIRILLKKGFTCQITRSSDWVDAFYDDYYRPTMIGSHGDEAYAVTRPVLRERLREPGAEFVCIYEGDRCVGAAICQHRDYYYHMISIGWLNGDPELRKKGVPSLLYWHSICRAYELGCTMLNAGGSPPYLENGVTRFKLPWGANFCRELTHYGYRDLLLNPSDPDCYRFLQENSIIAYGIDNCLIVLSSKRPEDTNLRPGFLKDIEAWYLLLPEKNAGPEAGSGSHLPAPLRTWYRLYRTHL